MTTVAAPNALVVLEPPPALAALGDMRPALFVPDAKTAEWFLGFFTTHVRNPNTRRAYYHAACRFSRWCDRPRSITPRE
jgi:hypothetical protein